MKKFEGTQEEWSRNSWTHESDSISIGAAGTPKICEVLLRDVSFNEQEANAKLITNSPKLLKSLLYLVKEIKTNLGLTDSDIDYMLTESGANEVLNKIL